MSQHCKTPASVFHPSDSWDGLHSLFVCVCVRVHARQFLMNVEILVLNPLHASPSLLCFSDFFTHTFYLFFFACLASQPVVALAWVCMIACMCTCKCVCVCLPACLCINMQRKQLAWLMAVPPRVPPRSCPLLYTMLIQLNTASSSSFSSAAAVALLLEASNRSRCLCVSACMCVSYSKSHRKGRANDENKRRLKIGEYGISVVELFTVMMKERRLH